ncbi:MAG: choice-of-anchor V domain-containing protein [Phycisphaerales bacterium]|nr:choice-of-anchor V domain-containing protein [Phycisphaerales bacterium]
MHQFKRVAVAVGVATTAAALSVALASRYGVDPGFSGGPGAFGLGQNCTACHFFNSGGGGVELFGAPRLYQAGRVYDLTIRVTDPVQVGAGFEISAEGGGGFRGSFLITDSFRTQFAAGGDSPEYVTHTTEGVDDSIAGWDGNGGSYEYNLAWQAPSVDSGPVTIFVAGNAVNNHQAIAGDRFYATYATMGFAEPGDLDGDGDVDLADFADVQTCFGDGAGGGCEYADLDGDSDVALIDVEAWVAAITGPTASLPAGYVLADPIRGGLLYDKWWLVNGAPAPTGDHPLWQHRPDKTSNTATGSATWRCKECHGWDYKGIDGDYGTGQHRTGFPGVFGTTLSPRQIFDLLKADPDIVTGGHQMGVFGMTDRDLWDVVKMTLTGVIDTDDDIAPDGSFIGDPFNGSSRYSDSCSSCHGSDGRDLNFGTALDPVYVGTLADENPWEFLHKVRFGHPASSMPSGDLLGWSRAVAADIGAFSQTLPVQ